MFEITYENQMYKQWTCEFIFATFDDAKRYLIDGGFVESGGIYKRGNYNWCPPLKAYISPKKVYREVLSNVVCS